jgi:colanic acid biosynthesis glycosyl transferase WcaI
MLTAFQEKGVPADRRVMLPNWMREGSVVAREGGASAAARRQFGVGEDAMLAIYAGNLGKKQSLEILGEAAALLAAPPPDQAGAAARVHILIAGDGAGRAQLEQAVRESGFAGVQLLPLLSDSDYAALLAAADVALITQAAGTGRFFFPSKLLSALAAGLPVVAVADETSELATAVREGGFGCTIPPGAAAELAALLRNLAGSPEVVQGWAARTVWVQKFARQLILPRFEEVLAAVAAGKNAVPSPQSQELVSSRNTQV